MRQNEKNKNDNKINKPKKKKTRGSLGTFV